MVICIDIGNTNIKYAIFDGCEVRFSFRVATDLKKTDLDGRSLFTMSLIRLVVVLVVLTHSVPCEKCRSHRHGNDGISRVDSAAGRQNIDCPDKG